MVLGHLQEANDLVLGSIHLCLHVSSLWTACLGLDCLADQRSGLIICVTTAVYKNLVALTCGCLNVSLFLLEQNHRDAIDAKISASASPVVAFTASPPPSPPGSVSTPPGRPNEVPEWLSVSSPANWVGSSDQTFTSPMRNVSRISSSWI